MPHDENPYAPPKEPNLPDCTSIEAQQAEAIRRAGLRRETTHNALAWTKYWTVGLCLVGVAWEIWDKAISLQLNLWCNLQGIHSPSLHDFVILNLLTFAAIHTLIALKLCRQEESKLQVSISGLILLFSLGAMLLFFEWPIRTLVPMLLGTIHLGVIFLLLRPLPNGITPEQYQQVVRLTPHLNQRGEVLAKCVLLMPAYFIGWAAGWYILGVLFFET